MHNAPLVQRLGYEPSKLETRVRLPDGAVLHSWRTSSTRCPSAFPPRAAKPSTTYHDMLRRGTPVLRSSNVEHIGTRTRFLDPKHSYLPRQWTEDLKKGFGQSCFARKVNDTQELHVQRTLKFCSTRAAHSKRCGSKRRRSALKTRTNAFPVLVRAFGLPSV